MTRLRQDQRSKELPRGSWQNLRLCEQALTLTRTGGWECDLATERLTWTDGLYRIYDLDPDTRLKRRSIMALYTDTSRALLEATRSQAIDRQRGFTVEVEISTACTNTRWVRIAADVVIEAGRAVRLFGAQQDITAERSALERLKRLAECDPLTGLANRGVFDARYRSLLADADGQTGKAVLVLADLDRFKAINDRFGHSAGDECLRQMAGRLRRTFPEALLIARFGGDEFALMLPLTQDRSGVAPRMSEAMAALGGPVFWNGHAIEVGVSLGAALLTSSRCPGGLTPFEQADEALYAAKAERRRLAEHIDGNTLPPLSLPTKHS